MPVQNLEKKLDPKTVLTAAERALIEKLRKENVVLIVYRDKDHKNSGTNPKLTDPEGYITEESWNQRGIVVAEHQPNSALFLLLQHLKSDPTNSCFVYEKSGIDSLDLCCAGSFDLVYGLFSHIPQNIVETADIKYQSQPGGIEIPDVVKVETLEYIKSVDFQLS